MTTNSLNNPAAGTGLPDPAVIARLANELFAALPGHPQDAVPQAPASELANVSGVPGAQSFPADANLPASSLPVSDLRALPASLNLGNAGFYFLDGGKAGPAPAQAGLDSHAFDLGSVPGLDLAPRPFDPHAVRHQTFRVLNEVPTLLMIGIVIMIIVRPWQR